MPAYAAFDPAFAGRKVEYAILATGKLRRVLGAVYAYGGNRGVEAIVVALALANQPGDPGEISEYRKTSWQASYLNQFRRGRFGGAA